MSEYVTDTHALYWHLTHDARLSQQARRILSAADLGRQRIHVSAISLVEMVYLVERGRLDADAVETVFSLLDADNGSYVVAALDVPVARALQQISRAAIPDMPDRIIAATARALDLPLITRDERMIAASVVTSVW